jgi:hypothetical protein
MHTLVERFFSCLAAVPSFDQCLCCCRTFKLPDSCSLHGWALYIFLLSLFFASYYSALHYPNLKLNSPTYIHKSQSLSVSHWREIKKNLQTFATNP